MIKSIISVVWPYALSFILGALSFWIITSPKQVEVPITKYIDYDQFRTLFPSPTLPVIPDYRFYVVDKIKTEIVEIEVPADMPDFRVYYNDIQVSSKQVRLPLWNPITQQYEADIFKVPQPSWGAGAYFTYTTDFGFHQFDIEFLIRYRSIQVGPVAGYHSRFGEYIGLRTTVRLF